jgi:hypothetical protein
MQCRAKQAWISALPLPVISRHGAEAKSWQRGLPAWPDIMCMLSEYSTRTPDDRIKKAE